MIARMGRRLAEDGHTAAKSHAMSHPRATEAEAFDRLITMGALIDQPVMIFQRRMCRGAGEQSRDRDGRSAESNFRRVKHHLERPASSSAPVLLATAANAGTG